MVLITTEDKYWLYTVWYQSIPILVISVSVQAYYKQRTAWQSISTINPAIMENTECTIVKARAPVIDIKVGVLP